MCKTKKRVKENMSEVMKKIVRLDKNAREMQWTTGNR